ncbi:MAG: DUF481 domain-containing protein [Gammaproteobacteria bacterium]|nr:MAG: DUF481 domain-containing protein [Gammaproteobacteria bacterium]
MNPPSSLRPWPLIGRLLLSVLLFMQTAHADAPPAAASSGAKDGAALEAAADTARQRAAWARFAPPHDDRHDWLQLKSGEWLKGELRSMYNYQVEFDSDKLKLLKLKWKDVSRLRTAWHHSVGIQADDDQRTRALVGRLELEGDTLSIINSTGVQRFPRERVVSIGASTDRALRYWRGKFSLGANLRSGNSDVIDGNIKANVRRLTAASRFNADYLGNFSRTDGTTTTNNHRLNGHFDRFLSRNFFWRMLYGEYFRDRLSNIERQLTLGTSYGYDIIRTPDTEWEVSGGLGATEKRFVSVGPGEQSREVSPSLRLGTYYDDELTSTLDLTVDFAAQFLKPDAGRYTHHLVTTLSSDLIDNLDLDISLVWDRVQEPRPAADGTLPKQDDYQLIVGVSYEF